MSIKNKKKKIIGLSILFVVCLLVFLVFGYGKLTGKAVFESRRTYDSGVLGIKGFMSKIISNFNKQDVGVLSAGQGYTGTITYLGEYEVVRKDGNESLYDVNMTETWALISNVSNNETNVSTETWRRDWNICIEANFTEINYSFWVDEEASNVSGLFEGDKEKVKVEKWAVYSVPDEMTFRVWGINKTEDKKRTYVTRKELRKAEKNKKGTRGVMDVFEQGDKNVFCYYGNTSEDFYILFGQSSIELQQQYTITTDLYNQNVTNEDVLYTHLNVSDANLAAYWSFDKDNATNVYDLTDKGNDGSVSGVTINATNGIISKGGYFDGNDFISASDSASLTFENFTFSAWVKIPSAAGTGGFFSQYNAPNLNGYWSGYSAGSYYIEIGVGSGSWSPSVSTPVTDTNWHHYVAIHNATYTGIYIDGVEKINSSTASVMTHAATNFNWGRDNRLADNYFVGNADEIKIYNRAFTPSEITALYQNQSSTFYPKGQQEYKTFNTTLTTENRVNVTTNGYERKQGTNISLSIGEWNVNNGYDDTDNSLVLSLHLDNRSSLGENSTYVVDSKYGNNGTAYNGASPTASGKYSKAYTLDGVNDYIQTNSNSQSVVNFTVSLWVNPGSSQEANANMIGQSATTYGSPKDGGWNILWQTTVWKFSWIYSSTESTTQPTGIILTPNVWSYITATKNGANASVYVNGVLQESFNGASPTIYYENPFPVILGAWYYNYDRNFNGSIDEVRIYNRSLSAQEIKQLYVTGLLTYNWTAEQNLTNVDSNDNSSLNTFTIQNISTDFIAKYRMYSNANNSYTPYLGNNNVSYNFYQLTDTSLIIAGRVVDANNNPIANAVVYIIRQATNTLVANLTANSTGGFSYTASAAGNYTVAGYDPNNGNRYGDIKPNVVVGLWIGLWKKVFGSDMVNFAYKL